MIFFLAIVSSLSGRLGHLSDERITTTEIMIAKSRYGDFFLLKPGDLISNALKLYGEWTQNKTDSLACAGAFKFLSKNVELDFLFAGQIGKTMSRMEFS
jgi:hypothetical protein